MYLEYGEVLVSFIQMMSEEKALELESNVTNVVCKPIRKHHFVRYFERYYPTRVYVSDYQGACRGMQLCRFRVGLLNFNPDD